ncbi:MAG: ATP-dependent DNA ligase [Promethearchaeota archaeon]|nr:MAG: ATP-dependent DNA ligase [Candidatus Lokiarchaeota archaeon]
MKFSILAKLFSNLENTSKRLEMIDMLAEFFQDIKNEDHFEDLNKIMYLLQGHLVSNIKQFKKMGVAEKMIIEALSLHAGIGKKKIKNILVKEGDIGATAEILLTKKKKQKSLFDFGEKSNSEIESIDIAELYSQLRKIAKTEGEGSQDSKLGILRGLMSKISPLETKYLLRIITNTLRVGVSTQTIIDGLALGFTGEKETNRDIIEKAYNLHPDLGDITTLLAKKGLEEVKNVKITYKIPIRMMLASRVPYSEIITRLGTPCIAEYKLDGERLQIHKKGNNITLFSRRLLNITEQYPDVCQVIRQNVTAQNVIFEGEVVAMDPFYEKMRPFQVLSKRRRKYDVKEMTQEVPVCLFVFDLLMLDDIQYINKKLPERRKILEKIIKEKDELKLVKSKRIHSTDELLEFFHEARNEGTEGIIAKSIKEDSVYQAGNRGFLWIKLKGLEGGKLKDSIDVVLVGAFYGKGRRTGVYGTYIGAVYDKENDQFLAFTRIASGWTDEIMESLMEEINNYKQNQKPKGVICEDKPDEWFSPAMVIEIFGDEITISEKFSTLGYSLRFPVFQRVRYDKGIKDITTKAEIIQLYNAQ